MNPLMKPLLQDLPFIEAFLIRRVPGKVFSLEREEALKSQMPFFEKTVQAALPEATSLVCAQEVHGTEIALVKEVQKRDPAKHFFHSRFIPNVDGLMTVQPHIALGITVADCAPVWIVDPQTQAMALVHSGRRGTEGGIVPKAIKLLQTHFSCVPENLIVAIGPCIRPPCYEVDIASIIREQALQAGVQDIRDESICTACHVDEYYSYRREKGKTGHMLAVVLKRVGRFC